MVTLRNALDAIEMSGSMKEDNDSGTSISITTAGDYYGWVSAGEGEVTNVTFASDATADKLVIPSEGAGLYQIEGNFSFSGTGGAVVIGALHVSGSPDTSCKLRRKIGAGGDTGNASLSPAIIDLSAADYLDVRFTSDDNGDSITIYTGSLTIRRIKRS